MIWKNIKLDYLLNLDTTYVNLDLAVILLPMECGRFFNMDRSERVLCTNEELGDEYHHLSCNRPFYYANTGVKIKRSDICILNMLQANGYDKLLVTARRCEVIRGTQQNNKITELLQNQTNANIHINGLLENNYNIPYLGPF